MDTDWGWNTGSLVKCWGGVASSPGHSQLFIVWKAKSWAWPGERLGRCILYSVQYNYKAHTCVTKPLNCVTCMDVLVSLLNCALYSRSGMKSGRKETYIIIAKVSTTRSSPLQGNEAKSWWPLYNELPQILWCVSPKNIIEGLSYDGSEQLQDVTKHTGSTPSFLCVASTIQQSL